MKKSVQKKQNTFSKKTAEKGAVPCGQNNHGSQRERFVAKLSEKVKRILQSYHKLEHSAYGKVDTLCVGEGKVFYATTDVERVLGFKKTRRYTSRHFKRLGVQVLPIPHPGNAERVHIKEQSLIQKQPSKSEGCFCIYARKAHNIRLSGLFLFSGDLVD